MRTWKISASIAAALLLAAGTARAGFLTLNTTLANDPSSYSWSNIGADGGGSISISTNSSDASDYQILATVDSDPHLNVLQDISNDTGVPWSGYTVTINPNPGFTLSNIVPSTPIFQPNYLPAVQVVGNQIIYSGGIVPAGATFETVFSFDVTSSPGSVGYTILNSAVLAPEPASLAMLGLGGLMLFRRRRS